MSRARKLAALFAFSIVATAMFWTAPIPLLHMFRYAMLFLSGMIFGAWIGAAE